MNTFECQCHLCGKSLIRKKQTKPVKFHFCDRVCKGEYQRQAKPVTREWLYEQYVTNGIDATQIAHMVGRAPRSVYNWLEDFGIPRRPRGHATPKTQFQTGHKQGVGRKLSAESRKKIRDKCLERGAIPFDPEVGPNGGRHGKDHPSWKGGITPERQAFYQTPEWRKASRAAWKRDGGFCQRCERHCDDDEELSFDLHHIVGFECVELRAEVSNLVLLCEKCHYWVHGSENVNRDFIKEI